MSGLRGTEIEEATREFLAQDVVPEGGELRWNYVGKGYRHRCAALYVENADVANRVFAMFMIGLARAEEVCPEDLDGALDPEDWIVWKRDSFGHGVLFYWPNVVSAEDK